MNTFLVAALLATPANPVTASADLEALFHVQQQDVIREIRDDMRADLRARTARFFAEDGELHRLLDAGVVLATR